MNLYLSAIGKRGYVADYFRPHLGSGDRIVGTSNTAWTPGFDSCDAGYLLPDIASDEYVPAVVELCARERITGLMSFFDPDVVALSRHLDAIRATGTTPILPSADIADACFDKARTARLLAEHGFDTPLTFHDRDAALGALAEGRLAYPVVVKPRRGFGSAHTFVARDERELEVFFGYAPDMLIQERLDGDAYDLEVCSDLAGRPLSVVPWRKLLSRLGETERAVTTKEPALMDLGVRLAEALRIPGPLDADVFVADGRVSVLEINPRFGGGYPCSHLAGADFPRLIVEMLRGQEPEAEIGAFEAGVVMLKKLTPMGGRASEFFAERLGVVRRPGTEGVDEWA